MKKTELRLGENRFAALDVFRGMTICFMIIVISPGSGSLPYWPLDHAAWNGFTPTDLVFPSFLFAVGNALSFSEKKFGRMADGEVVLTIFRRSFLIFLLGYLLCWFPFFKLAANQEVLPISLAETRFFGVLQRIAMCYLLTGLAVRYISRKYLPYVGVALLVLYWGILVVFGGADPFSIEGNAGTKLDVFLFGKSHLYFDHGVFDPEGLLSTLPAVVNTLAGYLAGKYLQENGNSMTDLRPLFIAGCIGIAVALCWDLLFPVNKKLWSSSFALLTIGMDLILLSLLVLVTQKNKGTEKGWTSFLIVFGKNPLFIYMLAEMLLVVLRRIPAGNNSLYEKINDVVFQAVLPGPAGSLFFALVIMLFCWFVALVLDRHKIYIKV